MPLWAAVAGLVLALGACAGGEPKDAGPRFRRVVLVTLDTLRVDHVHSYGYPRQTTPFIDSLARHGVRFERAFSSIATTTPAHASIFTALHPIEHGVMKNGQRLGRSFRTLAQLLHRAGVQTAAFVGTDRHFGPTGLNHGFRVFDEPVPGELAGVTSRGSQYRRADATVDAAIAWMDSGALEDDFFLWIHLFDPHPIFDPPPEYRAAIEKDPIADYLLAEQHLGLDLWGDDPAALTEAVDRYDGEIRFCDAELARLYAHMNERGYNDEALWIVTADHGEGLGDHRWIGHGKHIYNEQVQVPLVIRSLDGEESPGRVVEDVVMHVDLMPTIAERFGLDAHAGVSYQLEGRSLAPLLRGEGADPDRHAFSVRRAFDPASRPDPLRPEVDNYEDGETYALQSRTHKYIHRTTGSDEFFDLRSDPRELHNRIEEESAEQVRMRRRLLATIARLGAKFDAVSEPVDPATLERLREMGYVP